MAVARQVAARHPALRDPVPALDRVLRRERDRLLRDPVHDALSTLALRLQRRRAPVELARGLLHVWRARHRSLPTVHARARSELPGDAPRRLPRAALARARP